MRLTRCFVPTPLSPGSVVALPDAAAAHIGRVLRLRPGAALTLFDGRGGEYDARLLDTGRGATHAQVGEHRAAEREAPVHVTLLQCLTRAERMDWIVQKATELGVAAIVPVASRHCVVQLDATARQRRLAHWHSVVIGACEQCGRNRLPALRPVCTLPAACAQGGGDDTQAGGASLRLLLWPEAGVSLPALLRAALTLPALPAQADSEPAAPAGPLEGRRIALLVGPEGGLAADELVAAQGEGFQPCRLGPRILRAETAPLAALAAIQAVAGDFL